MTEQRSKLIPQTTWLRQMDGPSQNGSGGVNGSNGMTRADRFEDEKRRIIDSCFGKKDEDGSLLESYITHIRIEEDAAFPSSPPPPNSNPATKKPRLVIVAVRKSGRVRMHKARENANGTFSIGKTWMLDDLSAVQSFIGSVPTTAEEEQQKQWAGGIGFTVTLGKPYYWQANTQKEKQFFIASLVKIYTKYTGGKAPELLGFDAREREQLLGVGKGALPPSQTQSPSGPNPSHTRPPRRDPSREPARNPPSREPMPRPPPQMTPGTGQSFSSQSSRPPMRGRQDESPSGGMDSTGTNGLQNQANLRRLGVANQSQESFARSEDSASLPPRSRGGMNGVPNAPGRFQDRSITPNSLRIGTPDSNFSSARDIPNSNEIPPMQLPAPLNLPPERRRPPMPIIGDPRQRDLSDENIVPAPLASPGMRRDDLKVPVRSIDRTQSRDQDATSANGYSNQNRLDTQGRSRKASVDIPRSDQSQAPSSSTTAIPPEPQPTTISPPLTMAQEQEPEGDPRPGLGPMIKQKPLSTVVSPTSPLSDATEVEEDARPGLGPMIRKKSKADIANTFLKAAKTANSFSSFKPRAGGAAEKLRAAKMEEKSQAGPDGISGVVPAPSLLRSVGVETTSNASTPAGMPLEKVSSPRNELLPEVKITLPQSDRPNSIEGPTKSTKLSSAAEKSKTKDVKRPKPASEIMQKELASIGIESSILGGRGNDLVAAWDEFGWVGEGVHTKDINVMKDEIDRELNKAQAGGWLSILDQEDERIADIHRLMDVTIGECDELDGLLTLYLVELSTLNEDVAYIEAQGQGLQVQAANQKLLKAELESLIDTISISSEELASLREASLESPRGLEQIEKSLVKLFKAMLTTDSTLGDSAPRPSQDGSLSSGRPGGVNSELSNLRVVQEKKEVYRTEGILFLRRLKPFLQVKFAAAIDESRKALEREKGSNLARVGKVKLDPRNHDLSREVLWKYSPLMLFSREVDRVEWEELMRSYGSVARPLYQDEFRDAVFAWKRIGRKPTGDESDILFTSQIEKQTDGIATTARKLTVKRSQTLAKSLRSPTGDNTSKSPVDNRSDGRLPPNEVFSGIVDEMIPIMSMEQNFMVELFHMTSLEQHDFFDAINAAPPDMRRGGDLKRTRVMDPNRDLSKQVIKSMEEVFSFFLADMQSLVDWTLQADPLQGVGLIAAIERKIIDFEESSQEFLSRTFQKIHNRLVGLFTKFLDEQIRAIEDTKVKIKKRKGVIGFFRIFPSFSTVLETMLISADNLEIRETINNAYKRINKTMFESLKVIARENPSAQTAGADPEDKEALNYQILLIENMNHYLEEVDARSNPVLEDWKQNAQQEMDEHMSLYLGAVIRRPLGKLLDFLESTESLMVGRQPGEPSSKISSMPSHSKTTFKKVLASYDSKEIKKGIEILKRRVEKHFGDADDPGLSRGLVTKVQQNCEKYYERVEDRILTISRDVYDGDVIAEWTRADVASSFKR